MFKLKRLDSRGVAHHLVLVLVVLGVAISGTYYLVASHADTVALTSTESSAIEYACNAAAGNQAKTTNLNNCESQMAQFMRQVVTGPKISAFSTAQVTAGRSACLAAQGATSLAAPGTAAYRDVGACMSYAGLQALSDSGSQQPGTSTSTTASSGTDTASIPAPAPNAFTDGTETSSPVCNNVYGEGAYSTGKVDSSGQAVVVHCSEPSGNDPCGYIGSTPVPCTPARTTAASNTCNYGGTYPDCVRILGGTMYDCPANNNGSTVCSLSTSKPVSTNTPVPSGCYSTLDSGQKYVYCPTGSAAVTSVAPTDYNIVQQYQTCSTKAFTLQKTAYDKYVSALQACTDTYNTAEANLHNWTAPATFAKDPSLTTPVAIQKPTLSNDHTGLTIRDTGVYFNGQYVAQVGTKIYTQSQYDALSSSQKSKLTNYTIVDASYASVANGQSYKKSDGTNSLNDQSVNNVVYKTFVADCTKQYPKASQAVAKADCVANKEDRLNDAQQYEPTVVGSPAIITAQQIVNDTSACKTRFASESGKTKTNDVNNCVTNLENSQKSISAGGSGVKTVTKQQDGKQKVTSSLHTGKAGNSTVQVTAKQSSNETVTIATTVPNNLTQPVARPTTTTTTVKTTGNHLHGNYKKVTTVDNGQKTTTTTVKQVGNKDQTTTKTTADSKKNPVVKKVEAAGNWLKKHL